MGKEPRYIKGKDGKLAGSLPAAPNVVEHKILDTLPPKPYEEVSVSIETVYAKEAEINKTLSEGLAEISKSFDAIEEIYKERAAAREKAAIESQKRLAEAELAAKLAKEKYERILQERENNKPLNKIKKFFGIK